MHAFWQLAHKEPKTDAERAAVTAVFLLQLGNDLKLQAEFMRLTPEEVYSRVLRAAAEDFNMPAQLEVDFTPHTGNRPAQGRW